MFYLSACANSFLLRMSFPLPSTSRLFPTFFYIRFTVSFLLYKSLFHLELIFVQGGKYGFIWILTHTFICFDQHFVEDAGFFYSMSISCLVIENQMSTRLWIYIWVLISGWTDQHVCFMQTSCFLIETRIQIA